MARWMLDADICVYAMNRRPRMVRKRLEEMPRRDLTVSAIAVAELWVGVAKSSCAERNSDTLRSFLSAINVLDWPARAVHVYAEIRASLEREGRPIGAMDMLIAAHALYENATLVTNNRREFARVKGLRVESWVSSADAP